MYTEAKLHFERAMKSLQYIAQVDEEVCVGGIGCGNCPRVYMKLSHLLSSLYEVIAFALEIDFHAARRKSMRYSLKEQEDRETKRVWSP